jgi:hypothetical protein
MEMEVEVETGDDKRMDMDMDDALTSSASDNAESEAESNIQYYAYMMINTGNSLKKSQRIHTHIGVSKNPLVKVALHNAKATVSSKKQTQSAAPMWKLCMVIGPFLGKKAAHQFKRKWGKDTRGENSRSKNGKILAKEENIPVYSRDKKADKTLMETEKRLLERATIILSPSSESEDNNKKI